MIEKAQRDESLPVYGDGKNIRDWLYAEDHCIAVDEIVRNGKIGEVYNIGGNNEKANIDIVKIILNAVEKPESLINYVKDRPGHDRRYAIDSSKIQKELDWMPKTNFETGIQKTIQWYKDNPQWIKRILSGEYRKFQRGVNVI